MKSLRILIVGKDYYYSQRLERNIKQIGHEVVSIAYNVNTAIVAFSTTHPDLVIIDIKLGENKKEEIELVRIFNKESAIPIIFYLDKLADNQLRKEITKNASTLILSKSFDVSELEVNINKAISIINKQQTRYKLWDKRLESIIESVNKNHALTNKIYKYLTTLPNKEDNFWITERSSIPTKIVLRDICWIEVYDKDVIRIMTETRPIKASITLTAFEKKLNRSTFLRISQSCIVNVSKAVKLNIEQRILFVEYKNKKEEFRISPNFIGEFKKAINLIKLRK